MEEFKRIDGRAFDQIREIKAEVGLLKNADGSAYFEIGNTKVIAVVYGPREIHAKQVSPIESNVRARYHMAPFSVKQRKSPALSRREIEISKIIKEALNACIKRDLYPRSTIDIYIEVINADGSTRVASLNAASLALVDAGIFLYDLITAVSVGKVDGKLIVDLNDYEDQKSEADIPIAMLPSLGKIVLLQMDGHLSYEEFIEAINIGKKAINKIYEFQKACLKKKFEDTLKALGQL